MRIQLANIILIVIVGLSIQKLKIDQITLHFKDENDRVVLYHGLNVVYKPSPYHPTIDKFDPFNSLVDEDFQNFRKWGFNFIRLYVPWEGLEPEKGKYNTTLLDVIEAIVDKAKTFKIDVLLDSHQDLLSRKYCGEGAPDWAVKNHSGFFTEFPKPIVFSIKYDKDGYPALNECLKRNFGLYYPTFDVSEAFQAFYNNWEGTADSFASMWKLVAERFKNTDNVIGYELLNEPWNGNSFRDPELLLESDKVNLQPFYEKINTQIRKVDNDTLVFFEPTADDIPITFTDTPGGESYRDKVVFSYHVYCNVPTHNKEEVKICNDINTESMKVKSQINQKFKTGVFVTEFGAVSDQENDLQQIDFITQTAEERFQSWAYWQYKYYGDFTTSGGEAQSFYNKDGTLQDKKVKRLARTYFYGVCGIPFKTEFSASTGEFEFEFEYQKCKNNKNSELYISEEYYYEGGFHYEISECPTAKLQKLEDKFYYELVVPEECENKTIFIRIY